MMMTAAQTNSARSRSIISNPRRLSRIIEFAIAGFCVTAAFSPAMGQTSSENIPDKWTWNADSAEELNSGVESYKSARYDEAIAHFRKAIELNPTQRLAKTYLATALAQGVNPSVETADNLKTAQEAIEVFQQVLAVDPHDINSLKQVAGIYFSIKKLDDAKRWQKKVLQEDPHDPEAAYTIGAIDWNLAHDNATKALTEADCKDDGEGNIKAQAGVMQAIKAENTAPVEEAIDYLNRAIENRPNYSDAMVYLNLVYRRKADLDWGNDQARQEDVAKAKEWAAKGLTAREAEEGERNAAHP
jgi:tetratricopeptide (TPR) repeat protein